MRITAEEVRSCADGGNKWLNDIGVPGHWMPDGFLRHIASTLESDTVAVAEVAAIERVRGHEMRRQPKSYRESMGWTSEGKVFCCTLVDNPPHGKHVALYIAEDWPALAGRLDSLRPKPEPETWRLRNDDGRVTGSTFPSLEDARANSRFMVGKNQVPVREIIQPDGSILLVPERKGARDE
jgi:hypothetical protein